MKQISRSLVKYRSLRRTEPGTLKNLKAMVFRSFFLVEAPSLCNTPPNTRHHAKPPVSQDLNIQLFIDFQGCLGSVFD